MPDPLITLTTDFGAAAPYAAALKGVILALNPAARLVDLTHQVPPQDVRHAAFFLAAAVPYFPPGAIHVVVVDPGVGSDRALLYVEAGGHRLLAPDNGCWTLLSDGGGEPRVIRLAERRFWREPVSATFHGRDILAPVAAHLSLGADPSRLGPPAREWVRLGRPEPARGAEGLTGEVVFIDDYGNLITNIPAAALPEGAGRVTVAGRPVGSRVRTYAEAPPGTPVALVSSGGMLEVAVPHGSAARALGAAVGAPVVVSLRDGE
jgi:S-adenosylmethionine hydrolase